MKIIYQCEICGRKYPTEGKARACEALPMRDFDPTKIHGGCHMPKVGEVVECSYPAWGWWDGDKDWSIWQRRGGRFLDGYYALWVVVARVPAGDEHKWKYILWTPSDQDNRKALRWTGPDHVPARFNRMATDEELAAAQATYRKAGNNIPLL